MLLILVDEITERISYTIDFIFSSRSVEFRFITSVEEFESDEKGIRLNYSTHETKGGRTIRPANIMSQKGFSEIFVDNVKYEGVECLSFNGETDIVASVFFVLTRYEEYDQTKQDQYGRFPYKESILKEFKWIEMAVCDRWSRHLIELLDKDLYLDAVLRSSLTTEGRKFIPSFDIDNVFAYQYKKGVRKFLSVSKDLFNADKKRLSERREVNSGTIKDPYDTYDKIIEVSKTYPDSRIFWLTGSNGEKDRNLSLDVPEHIDLIKKMSAHIKLGLHPTFASFKTKGVIRKEKELLEKISGQNITSSRQHFLRFRLPDTFEELIRAGITDEYSMGFAEQVGFRCGTARPHKWFNIKTNEKTDLTVHPFIYMDGSFREYMKITIEESKVKVGELYKEVKHTGGDFVFIWHNETIGDYNNWKGWSALLDHTLNIPNE